MAVRPARVEPRVGHVGDAVRQDRVEADLVPEPIQNLVPGRQHRPRAVDRCAVLEHDLAPAVLLQYQHATKDGVSVNGTWTMLPAGHEILDRLWDEVRFDAVLADGVPYVAHARLYARWPHRHSLTTHGAVLRGTRGFLRPVVASFELSHVT